MSQGPLRAFSRRTQGPRGESFAFPPGALGPPFSLCVGVMMGVVTLVPSRLRSKGSIAAYTHQHS